MALIRAHGISASPPTGWEAHLRTLEEIDDEDAGVGPDDEGDVAAAAARSMPRAPRANLHVANFALPRQRGDFGGGAVELMGARHAFVSLVEYSAEQADTALFARQGMPRRVRANEFDPQALQRTIAGQAGLQRFFSVDGRAFCLYVVLGSHRMNRVLTPAVNEVLTTVDVA